MFDIDGTLTQSSEVDAACFISAMKTAFNINHINADWSKYKHFTDSGIFGEIFESHFHRKPEAVDFDLIKANFIQVLKAAIEKSRICCSEIAGAVSAFNWLKNNQNYAVSFGTGCWKESAELKLKSAGFDFIDIPFAGAEDSIEREKIMLISLDRAKKKYNIQNFDSITYIGDGVWDVIASKNLGFNFIGIAQKFDEQKLIDTGAKFVMPDFKDFTKFLAILNSLGSDEFARKGKSK